MITLKTGWLSRVTSGKNHSQGVKRKHVSRARHLEMCTKVTSIIRRWGWYPSRYCGRGLGGWRHWLDWRWFATWDNSTLELLVRYCYLLFIMIYTNQTYMIYLYTWCCICLHMYIYIYHYIGFMWMWQQCLHMIVCMFTTATVLHLFATSEVRACCQATTSSERKKTSLSPQWCQWSLQVLRPTKGFMVLKNPLLKLPSLKLTVRTWKMDSFFQTSLLLGWPKKSGAFAVSFHGGNYFLPGHHGWQVTKMATKTLENFCSGTSPDAKGHVQQKECPGKRFQAMHGVNLPHGSLLKLKGDYVYTQHHNIQ